MGDKPFLSGIENGFALLGDAAENLFSAHLFILTRSISRKLRVEKTVNPTVIYADKALNTNNLKT